MTLCLHVFLSLYTYIRAPTKNIPDSHTGFETFGLYQI